MPLKNGDWHNGDIEIGIFTVVVLIAWAGHMLGAW